MKFHQIEDHFSGLGNYQSQGYATKLRKYLKKHTIFAKYFNNRINIENDKQQNEEEEADESDDESDNEKMVLSRE